MNEKQETVESLLQSLSFLYSKENKNGWNNYPIYVECDDGITRKVQINSKVIPNGWKEKSDNKNFVKYDGGFYLKAIK